MILFKKYDLQEGGTNSKSVPYASQSAAPARETKNALKHEPLSDALEIYHDVINDALRARGINADEAYKPDSGLWIVPAQPAPVVLRIKQDDVDDVDYIEAVMRLGPLPAQNLLPFYRALLESNMRLANVAFAVGSDGVFLRHERPLAGLDEDELNDIVAAIINAADEEFGALLEQFIFGASILR